jgi:hypothetical protein
MLATTYNMSFNYDQIEDCFAVTNGGIMRTYNSWIQSEKTRYARKEVDIDGLDSIDVPGTHDRYWLPNLFDHYLHALVYISAVRTRPDGIHILGSKLDLRIEVKCEHPAFLASTPLIIASGEGWMDHSSFSICIGVALSNREREGMGFLDTAHTVPST